MSIPQTLNHYRILGPLGKGGMGEVFVAEDTRLHRKVALKVLSRAMAGDPERRGRFEREAQAVAAINHPSIVTIYSVEEADGVPFLTMELVEGRTLGDLISSGALPVDRLLRIGIAVSDAVGAAHQRGITHRDLKPANIIVTDDDRVKVLDFGLAKLREAHLQGNADDETRLPSGDLTGEGRIIGTVAYMSPEQAEGKPVDQRSDIFSLGVVLHEMATGERPFKGDTNVSVISSILKDTPSAITDLNPALPAGLARVIRRALSKDPSRRFQTATDLRNELEELKQDVDSGITSSGARPAVSSGRAGRPLVLGVALLVAIAAVAAAYLWSRPDEEAVPALAIDRMVRLTSAGNAFLAALSPDGRYVVHVKDDAGALSLWIRQTATTSDVQIVPPARVRYDGVTYSPDGNYVYYVTYDLTGGIGTLYRVAVLGGTPQRILEDLDSRVSFSPDGTRFTFVRGLPLEGSSLLMVANADGSGAQELARLTAGDQFTLNGPSWSPDGATIVAPAQSVQDGPHALVVAVDVASGRTTRVPGRWTATGDIVWLPDGRSFLVCAAELGRGTQQIWQVLFPSGEARRVTNDLNTYISVSVSGDGREIATVQAENLSNIWVAPADDPGGGRQVTRGRGRADGQAGISWMPDGSLVFGSTTNDRPQIWRVNADGEDLRPLTTQDDPAFSPDVARDGSYIVFQRLSGGGMHIWRMNPDGSNQRQLTNGSLELFPVAGSDGFVYYFTVATGSPKTWKVPADGGTPVPVSEDYFRLVDLSPDGRQLLGAGWDSTAQRSVTVVMSTDGTDVTPIEDAIVFALAWTPDGKGISFLSPGESGVRLMRLNRGDAQPIALGTIADTVFNYAWSPDGTQIALSRGQRSSDVVLLKLKDAVDE